MERLTVGRRPAGQECDQGATVHTDRLTSPWVLLAIPGIVNTLVLSLIERTREWG